MGSPGWKRRVPGRQATGGTGQGIHRGRTWGHVGERGSLSMAAVYEITCI